MKSPEKQIIINQLQEQVDSYDQFLSDRHCRLKR